MNEAPEPSEVEIDAVLAEFAGDHRAAIRALLHDLALLAADHARTVSRGYVRGRGLFPLAADPEQQLGSGVGGTGR